MTIRAAHETLERDAAGHHRFLGYGLTITLPSEVVTLVHSGDTVPFDGQVAELATLRPDLLLLPVNGRHSCSDLLSAFEIILRAGLALRFGGSISAEHGIGRSKKKALRAR